MDGGRGEGGAPVRAPVFFVFLVPFRLGDRGGKVFFFFFLFVFSAEEASEAVIGASPLEKWCVVWDWKYPLQADLGLGCSWGGVGIRWGWLGEGGSSCKAGHRSAGRGV